MGSWKARQSFTPKRNVWATQEGGKVKRVGEYREDQKVGRREKNVRVSEGRR